MFYYFFDRKVINIQMNIFRLMGLWITILCLLPLPANSAKSPLETIFEQYDPLTPKDPLSDLISAEQEASRLLLLESAKGQNKKIVELAQDGLKKLQNNDKEGGIRDLNLALEQKPEFKKAAGVLAIFHLKDQEYDKALDVAKHLQNVFPDSSEGHIIAGIAYAGLGDRKKSRAGFEKALKITPGIKQATKYLAAYELNENNYDAAKSLYKKSLFRYPKDPSITLLLAKIYLAEGETNNAIKIIDEVVNDSPELVHPHYYLALAYVQLNKYKRAIREIDKTLALNKDFNPSKLLRSRIYLNTGQYEQANEIIQKLILIAPDNDVIRGVEGKIAMAQNRPSDAVKAFQVALKTYQSSDLTVSLGRAQAQMGDKASAYSTFNDWLVKYPDDGVVRESLARLLVFDKSFNAARKEYEKLVRLQPERSDFRNNVAWLLLQNKEIDKALKQIVKAYQLTPYDATICDTYGEILLSKGKTEKALEMFKQAFKIKPKDVSINLHLIQAHVQMGNIESARDLLDKIQLEKLKPSEQKQVDKLLVTLKAN